MYIQKEKLFQKNKKMILDEMESIENKIWNSEVKNKKQKEKDEKDIMLTDGYSFLFKLFPNQFYFIYNNNQK